MLEQASYELIVGSGSAELLRLPLLLGAHRVGAAARGALRVAGLRGMLHVDREGVAWRDEVGEERRLSHEPARFGDVELRVEPLQLDGEDCTATHEHTSRGNLGDVIRMSDLRGARDYGRIGKVDVLIGSDSACRVRLESSRVSRQHCLLYRRAGRLFVRDLGSKNGTYLNGTSVSHAEVHVPAHLRVGDVELRIESQESISEAEGIAPALIGRSEPVKALRALIARFAPHDAPVLVHGESGSGKELVARGLHDRSRRKHGPLVAVNCGALAPTLVESELFGHARGAFTGASERRMGAFLAASGGTLFLDEIGELPLHLQPMLLRVLETREVRAVGDDRPTPVDVRIVAATHRDLRRDVSDGRFREDLFHRLNVLKVVVPPLRDRGGDILLLAQHFARALAPNRPIAFSPDAAGRLLEHPFSGNVRELKNVIHRAIYASDTDMLLPLHLDLEGATTSPVQTNQGLEVLERSALLNALAEAGGSPSEAARRLGIARSTVYRKIAALGLKR